MLNTNYLLGFCLMSLLVIAGCSTTLAEEPMKKIFYENEEIGLKIYETSDWRIDAGASSEPFNATFKQGNIRAIVSVIPEQKTISEIKKELAANKELFKLIEESDTHVALEINEHNRVRSDIFTEQAGKDTLIVTFLTPLAEYENNKGRMEEFKNSIQLIY